MSHAKVPSLFQVFFSNAGCSAQGGCSSRRSQYGEFGAHAFQSDTSAALCKGKPERLGGCDLKKGGSGCGDLFPQTLRCLFPFRKKHLGSVIEGHPPPADFHAFLSGKTVLHLHPVGETVRELGAQIPLLGIHRSH